MQYNYLMHALLGLAGSHSALQIEDPNTHATLSHRQQAILGLEETFKRWPPPAEEAHVMLATSYLLCFQASYIEDGFLEHILSLRGCASLSQLILNDGLDGPFTAQANMHTVFEQSTFSAFPHLDQELACEALLSLKAFSHLLSGPTAQPIEHALVASLVQSIRPLLVPSISSPQTAHSSDDTATPQNPLLFPSTTDAPTIDWSTITTPHPSGPNPLASFTALMSSLLILSSFPHAQVLHLFDPANHLSAIVLSHFLAVRLVVSPLSAPQTGLRVPVAAMVKWTERVLDCVQGEWRAYVEWPRKVLRCMKETLEGKRGLDFGDCLEMLRGDAGAFREGRGWNKLALKRE